MTQNVDGIRRMVDSNDFAASLVNQFDRFGGLSDAQWRWVVKLQMPTPDTMDMDATPIHDMFKQTATRLKGPRIRVLIGEQLLALSRAGDRSRFPGSINVTDGKPFRENRWYGRITESRWEPSRDCESWVTEWLVKFANDPVTVAAEYGKMTGYCCFCNRTLSDDRSVEVGYGPVCADSWGMPWGEKGN